MLLTWLPWRLSGKESACSASAAGLIPEWGGSPGGGHDNPLQYSCLVNPMVRGAWWATVQRAQRVGHDWSDLARTQPATGDLTLVKETDAKRSLLQPLLWLFYNPDFMDSGVKPSSRPSHFLIVYECNSRTTGYLSLTLHSAQIVPGAEHGPCKYLLNEGIKSFWRPDFCV